MREREKKRERERERKREREKEREKRSNWKEMLSRLFASQPASRWPFFRAYCSDYKLANEDDDGTKQSTLVRRNPEDRSELYPDDGEWTKPSHLYIGCLRSRVLRVVDSSLPTNGGLPQHSSFLCNVVLPIEADGD